jgi:hypothetical protein
MMRCAIVLWLLAPVAMSAPEPRPVSFTNDVMAVLGKAGCNAGACHGHNSGKAGFKLSLRGYDRRADHSALIDPDSGRVDLKDVSESLILQMPTAQLDHGGGKRFEVGSQSYRLLRDWIRQGARSDVETATKLSRIVVRPSSFEHRAIGQTQSLRVTAVFADGTQRDVTRLAIYELASEGVVEVDAGGRVTSRRPGESGVLVRFLGKKALSRALVIRTRAGFAWSDPPQHNFIDRHIDTKLKTIQVLPSDVCTDAEFLRRISLDICGLPPDRQEVTAFLEDRAADRRVRKIDELLSREDYGDSWAMGWLELSGTTESGDSARFKGIWTLSLWLRRMLNENLPYDRLVRELVAGKGSSIHNPSITFTVNQLKRVETVPQLFLGIRLQCAECHDHPFDSWTQSNYRAMTKFFGHLGQKEGPIDPYGREIRRFIKPELRVPWRSGERVELVHLDGSRVKVPVTSDRRDALVDWMFGPGRRMTSRAIVNRIWGRMLGRGIVEPVDDMRFSNPAVNEPLLEALADDLVANGWDLKHLLRTIARSRTYQHSSIPNDSNRHERVNFSHGRLRRLGAEQLADVVSRVTGVDESYRVGPPGLRAVHVPYVAAGSRLLKLFGRPAERASACECVRSPDATLPQVMYLLNGEELWEKIRSPEGTVMALVKEHAGAAELVAALYVAMLSRPATRDEQSSGARYLADSKTRAEGAEDLAWALLNSPEFLFNH